MGAVKLEDVAMSITKREMRDYSPCELDYFEKWQATYEQVLREIVEKEKGGDD